MAQDTHFIHTNTQIPTKVSNAKQRKEDKHCLKLKAIFAENAIRDNELFQYSLHSNIPIFTDLALWLLSSNRKKSYEQSAISRQLAEGPIVNTACSVACDRGFPS